MHNEFLYWFLKSKTEYLNSLGRGATFKEISKAIVEGIVIPFPPIEEQKNIAELLNNVNEFVGRYKKIYGEFDNLIKSIFFKLFGHPFEGDQKKKKEFMELCTLNPNKGELSLSDDDEISFIPMQNVSETGEIDASEIRLVHEVKSGYTYFRENDVLFAKITPCMENGKGAIARGLVNGVGFGSTEFHVLRPIEGVTTSEWLYHLTSLPEFRKLAESNMTGSAGQKRVPASFFKKLKVAVPPLDLQNQFAEIVAKIEEQKALVKKAIEETQTLFDSLMSKYFDD